MSAALSLQSAALSSSALKRSRIARPVSMIASLGDSITYQFNDGVPQWKRPYGYQTWAEILSGGAARFPSALNFGIGGNRTDQMLARVGDVIAARPDACVVMGGVNDLRSLTAEQSMANLRQIYETLLASGILPVAVPPLPAGILAGTALSVAEQRQLSQLRRLIRSHSLSSGGLVIADATDMLIAHGTGDGVPLGGVPSGSIIPAAVTYDGLHPAVRGAFWTGRAIASALATRLGGQPNLHDGDNDAFDAASNPTGSKIGSALSFGNGGGSVTGGAQGVAPSGWVLQQLSPGGTVSGSFEGETLENGESRQRYRLDFSTTSQDGEARARFYRQIYSGFEIGEVVEGIVEVEVSDIAASCMNELQLQVNDASGEYSRVLGFQVRTLNGSKFLYPDIGWKGVLRTEPMTVGSAVALDFVLSFGIAAKDGAAASLRIGRPRLARVMG